MAGATSGLVEEAPGSPMFAVPALLGAAAASARRAVARSEHATRPARVLDPEAFILVSIGRIGMDPAGVRFFTVWIGPHRYESGGSVLLRGARACAAAGRTANGG